MSETIVKTKGVSGAKFRDALSEALKGQVSAPTGYTAGQMAQATGKSRAHVLVLLRQLIQEGKWRYAGKIEVADVTGSRHRTPVYQQVKQGRSSGKSRRGRGSA